MKLLNKKIRTFLAASLVVFTATSCEDFFDINKDPNNPLDARLDQLLPTVETVIFEAFGNGAGGMSDLTSQYVHHTVQRVNANFYFFAGNEFSIASAWPNLYAGALKDLNVMIDKATERNSYNYLGVAQTLKAYTYSMMVDLWGKASYFDFGQGIDNPFPGFDDGATIYAELFTLLDEATVNLAKDSQEEVDEDVDLVYGADMDKWIAFANSLKLKMYNQVRLTPLYDAAAVANIINSQPMITGIDGGFKLLYGESNNPENRHPLFNQDYVQNNPNYIDPYFYLIMKGDASLDPAAYNDIYDGIEDPRIPYYFYNQLAGDDPQNDHTTAYWGDFLSIWFASLNIDPNEGFDQGQSQTLVGLYPAGGAYDDGSGTTGGVANNQNPGLGGAGYQRLYPYFAHLYTLAELALTKGAPGDARTYLRDAMNASFAEVNELTGNGVPAIDVADRNAYVNAVLALYDGENAAGKLEHIMTQKWIASFGFSVDAYTDYRRTGYPIMFNPNADANPYTILNRAYPLSIPYFTDDLQINPNADPQRNPATDRVFWDVD